MNDLQELFDKNQVWRKELETQYPHFFEKSAQGQKPDYLWIGCSDSRVPVNQIVNALPGDIFVHRNIANLILQTDSNGLSVIQFAVEILKVKHIIVCGHYNCGGVTAALKDQGYGLIEKWIQPIKKIRFSHKTEIDSLASEADQINKLCELNVEEQVKHVCQTSFVQEAWKAGKKLSVHGLIYDLKTGLLKDLGIHISGI